MSEVKLCKDCAWKSRVMCARPDLVKINPLTGEMFFRNIAISGIDVQRKTDCEGGKYFEQKEVSRAWWRLWK